MLSQLLALKDATIGTYPQIESHAIYGRAVPSENGRSPLFSQELFTKLLCLERKRAERSRKPFALMLIDASKPFRTDRRDSVYSRLLRALSESTRETDIWGWYKEGFVVGVIFTEIGSSDTRALRDTIMAKVQSALQVNVGHGPSKEIGISLHVFPEDPSPQNGNGGSGDTQLPLYPDLQAENDTKRGSRLLKRGMDIVGSLAALILLSPVFLVIAAAIKLTSKGPVLYKQKRVGEHGALFTFLKFRSMYTNNDDKSHREYLRQLIAGKRECDKGNGNGHVYKLKDDPRITPLGRFLRKTSLDELPQFFNVLRGEMALVGPRPPIPYETEVYDVWHRRRFLEVKPGITGLWQISGRNRLKFDEMVRLDIRYSTEWSVWLDLKILLATPRVVLFGDGAY
jgi:lipopolysaccharide/colanic/teichoic acid biosynthesis glycosyltransferase